MWILSNEKKGLSSHTSTIFLQTYFSNLTDLVVVISHKNYFLDILRIWKPFSFSLENFVDSIIWLKCALNFFLSLFPSYLVLWLSRKCRTSYQNCVYRCGILTAWGKSVTLHRTIWIIQVIFHTLNMISSGHF